MWPLHASSISSRHTRVSEGRLRRMEGVEVWGCVFVPCTLGGVPLGGEGVPWVGSLALVLVWGRLR